MISRLSPLFILFLVVFGSVAQAAPQDSVNQLGLKSEVKDGRLKLGKWGSLSAVDVSPVAVKGFTDYTTEILVRSV